MADVKISELTALTSPDGAEELVVNDGGTTKKITIANATSAALPKAGGTMTGDTLHGDNVKAKFGASGDLEIYHDGSNTRIHNNVGDLYLRNYSDNKQIFIQTDNGAGGHTNYVSVNGLTGAVELSHYGSEKLATTSTGVNVTGTMLVGKSATGFGTQGVELGGADGKLFLTRNNNSLYLNRLSTDGNIAQFYKDGTTVGSIGIEYSDNTYVGGNATHTKIGFGTTAIYPSNGNGSPSDADTDIGSINNRFKDLYLSGGLYLGGVGSSNKLDDYEEGTWTPTLPNGGSVSINKAIYTKIGNLVTAYMYIASSATQNGVQFRVGGLPFNATATNYYAGGSLGYCGNLNTNDWCQPLVANSSNYIYFHKNNGGAHVLNNQVPAGTPLIIQVTYTTNS